MNTRNRRRVVRGCSWGNRPGLARASCRIDFSPDYRDDDFGFRLVLRRLK